MKKTMTFLLCLLMMTSLIACGNAADQPIPEQNLVDNTANDATPKEDRQPDDTNRPDEMEEQPEESEGSKDAAPEDSGKVTDIDNSQTAENQPEETEAPEEEKAKVLVAYFSATNTTEGIAENIANGLNADLYEIVPEVPYTDADLNYNDNNSRTSIEMNDPNARPAISGSVENMEQYDIVFIGYPIWWGEAPQIMNTFIENYDFSGKTIVPFCTSGSSSIGSSAVDLQEHTSGANWLDGKRFNGSDSQDVILSWIDSLGLDLEE